MFWTKKRRFYEKKSFIIVSFVLLALVGLRMILPKIIKDIANQRLEEESPYFSFNIDNIDLEIIRGKVDARNIVGVIKETGDEFIQIGKIRTDLSWRKIFVGKVSTEVDVTDLHLTASDTLLAEAKKEGERVKAELEKRGPRDPDDDPVLRVDQFRLSNSSVTLSEFMEFTGDETRKISDINVEVSDLIATLDNPVTYFFMTANIFGSAPLRVEGTLTQGVDPIHWDINSELHDFELSSLNPLVKDKVEALIERGTLDFYAEAKSEDGKIEGYLKPFIKKMKLDTTEGFNLVGEVAAKGGNLVKILLSDSEDRTVATRMPFTYEDENLKLELMTALQKAVKHRVSDDIPSGLEDSIGQEGLGVRQAQEE